MAKDSFPMLARESQAGTGELRVKVLETIFDLLILWGVDFVEELGFDVCFGFFSFRIRTLMRI